MLQSLTSSQAIAIIDRNGDLLLEAALKMQSLNSEADQDALVAEWLAETVKDWYKNCDAERIADKIVEPGCSLDCSTFSATALAQAFLQFNGAIQSAPVLISERFLQMENGIEAEQGWHVFFKKAGKIEPANPSKLSTTTFKCKINDLDDLARLFNSRLYKLRSAKRFYRLPTKPDQKPVYILLTPQMAGEYDSICRLVRINP